MRRKGFLVFLCVGLGEMFFIGFCLLELEILLVIGSIKLFLEFKYKGLFDF